MLWTPNAEFHAIISNVADGTQPVFNPGTVVAAHASTNTKGDWVELLDGTAVTHDAYAIELIVSDYGANNALSAALMDIGIDPTNSDTFTVLINNLNVSNAGTWIGGDAEPMFFYFPLFVPAGTQIAARVQSNVGGRSGSVWIRLFTKPKHPELVRCGSYVTTFGADTGTSLGTSVTPGTASEGAWVDLAGADTTLPYWFWQYGAGVNDSTMGNGQFYVDIGVGDGSNKHVVIQDAVFISDDNEGCGKLPHYGQGAYEVPAGVRVYGRMQGSGLDSNYHMCAYGIGG